MAYDTDSDRALFYREGNRTVPSIDNWVALGEQLLPAVGLDAWQRQARAKSLGFFAATVSYVAGAVGVLDNAHRISTVLGLDSDELDLFSRGARAALEITDGYDEVQRIHMPDAGIVAKEGSK